MQSALRITILLPSTARRALRLPEPLTRQLATRPNSQPAALPSLSPAERVQVSSPPSSRSRAANAKLCGAFAAMAAIFVQDPIVMPPFPGEAFAKLYGLTGSELRVLLAMAPGLSVKEAAEVLGIGENTAKTHLQHIHSKTGTSKQTELMRLFMSSTPPVNAAQQPAGQALGKYRLEPFELLGFAGE